MPDSLEPLPADTVFTARNILVSAPTVTADASCGKVVTLLVERPDLPCLAIVEADGAVLGVIGRERLLATFAQQLLADLYRRRPILSFIETTFLAVEADTDIDEIGQKIATEHPRALVGGFVVTDGGRYAGIGTGVSLLSKTVELTRTRARQLEVARSTAEQANRAKSTFLAAMSHEIRTPLNGVVGNLELLNYTVCDAEQGELVQAANTAAQTLLQIIGDVLDFSKIESEKIEIERVEMAPADVLDEVITLFGSRARQKNLALTGHVGAGVPERIRGDPLRLRQIVLNFVGNSLKFTEIGGIHITLTRMWTHHPEVRLRFEVTDTGVGFRPEKAASLFEPFTQEDGSTTRRFGGSGLGLAICKKLAELMAGTVGCDGSPGMGSSFWLEVPVTAIERPDAMTGGAGAASGPAIDLTGAAVLLVDEVAAESVEARSLRAAGASVETAGDALAGLEAVRLAQNHGRPFDVVVIDERLPDGGSGLTLADALTHQPCRRVLTCTGWQVPLRRAAHRRGFSHVVVRPCPTEEVLRAVAGALGRLPERGGDARGADLAGHIEALGARGVTAPMLVIDDAPMNRTVAQRQLAKLGLACDTAEDGAQGLALATTRAYALILVDGSMPVMDGYAFTRHYREWEAGGDRRVPVIAMTAHALADDVRKSLDAGMDDHLTKPVTIERLAVMLERWLGGGVTPVTSVGPVRPAGVKEEGKVTAPGAGGAPVDLDQLTEILGAADEAEFKEVLGFFRDAFMDLYQRLADAVAAGDRIAIRDAAHAAKGAARNAAARPLAKAMADIEAGAPAEPMERLQALTAASRPVFSEVERFIGRLVAG